LLVKMPTDLYGFCSIEIFLCPSRSDFYIIQKINRYLKVKSLNFMVVKYLSPNFPSLFS